MEYNSLHLGDCFDVMALMPDKCLDMVLCDLPYGVTACRWDVELDLEQLWREYKRLLKPGGAVVLAALNTGRRYVCVEKDMANYLVMVDRVQQHKAEIVE